MAEGYEPAPILVIKEYPIETLSNAMVSPFSAYVQVDLSSDVNKYGKIISCMTASASQNPSMGKLTNAFNGLHIYSRSPESFYVRVTFSSCPTV